MIDRFDKSAVGGLFFILDEQHQPIQVDFRTWAVWFEDFNNRRVAEDKVGALRVSTVFLGITHMGGIFETMVFDGKQDLDQWRYETWADALAGHARVVEELKQKEKTRGSK